MPSKTTLAAPLAVAVAAGLALTAGAGAQSSGPTTLALTAKPTGGTAVDAGRKGVSPGDEFFEHGIIQDAAGHASGRFQMTHQLISGNARRGSEQSTLTLDLPDGQIVVSGGHRTTSRFTMAVLGGTGGYSAANGTLAVEPGRGESERLTIRLGG
jgi:hypothetical protein